MADLPDPGRLRFVAANYQFLQGLNRALLGACLLLYEALLSAGAPGGIFVVVLAAGFPASIAVNGYYDRWFGSLRTSFRANVVAAAGTLGAVLLSVFAASHLHRDMTTWCLSAGCLCLFARSRGRCWYYLPVAIVLAAFGLSSAELSGGTLRKVIGASLVITGLLDHRLLVRSLAPAEPQVADA